MFAQAARTRGGGVWAGGVAVFRVEGSEFFSVEVLKVDGSDMKAPASPSCPGVAVQPGSHAKQAIWKMLASGENGRKGRQIEHASTRMTSVHDPGLLDVRLPGKGNSTPYGARPVHLIISMIKWIRTSRLSSKRSALDTCLQSSPKCESGTYKTVTARFWPWLPGKSNSFLVPSIYLSIYKYICIYIFFYYIYIYIYIYV